MGRAPTAQAIWKAVRPTELDAAAIRTHCPADSWQTSTSAPKAVRNPIQNAAACNASKPGRLRDNMPRGKRQPVGGRAMARHRRPRHDVHLVPEPKPLTSSPAAAMTPAASKPERAGKIGFSR